MGNRISLLGVALVTLSCQPLSMNSRAVFSKSPTAVATPSVISADIEVTLDDDEQAAFDFFRGRRTGLTQDECTRLAKLIVREANYYYIDPMLVLAVIQIESTGNPRAVSHVGAMGLMQLMPDTAKEFAPRLGIEWKGPEMLFDPELNVRVGISYLSYLFDRFEDLSIGLVAYNWGPTRIERNIREGGSLPSIYVDQVLGIYDMATLERTSFELVGVISSL